MKHRATIDLEFTNGDLFEQEVIKAIVLTQRQSHEKHSRTKSRNALLTPPKCGQGVFTRADTLSR